MALDGCSGAFDRSDLVVEHKTCRCAGGRPNLPAGQPRASKRGVGWSRSQCVMVPDCVKVFGLLVGHVHAVGLDADKGHVELWTGGWNFNGGAKAVDVVRLDGTTSLREVEQYAHTVWCVWEDCLGLRGAWRWCRRRCDSHRAGKRAGVGGSDDDRAAQAVHSDLQKVAGELGVDDVVDGGDA